MSGGIVETDAAALDADILRLINGMSLRELFEKWVATKPAGEDQIQMARLISERVHDVLQTWVDQPPTA